MAAAAEATATAVFGIGVTPHTSADTAASVTTFTAPTAALATAVLAPVFVAFVNALPIANAVTPSSSTAESAATCLSVVAVEADTVFVFAALAIVFFAAFTGNLPAVIVTITAVAGIAATGYAAAALSAAITVMPAEAPVSACDIAAPCFNTAGVVSASASASATAADFFTADVGHVTPFVTPAAAAAAAAAAAPDTAIAGAITVTTAFSSVAAALAVFEAEFVVASLAAANIAAFIAVDIATFAAAIVAAVPCSDFQP
jgi:hypothetical protein